MSDRCSGWRLLLSRRADGDLSRYDSEALEDHLAGCRECREAARSDRELHLALTREDFSLDHDSSRRIDDSILQALGIPERLTWRQRIARSLRELWARWEAVPNLYLTQMVGGTLAAASLTAVFLLTALHPVGYNTHRTGEIRKMAAFHASAPPVPLESLLDRPSPRAASLWTIPLQPRPSQPASEDRPALPSSPPPAQSGPQPPRQHGALPDMLIRS